MAGLREIEIRMSQKGKPQALFDGFLYTKNGGKEDTIYWKCAVKQCNGRLTTVKKYVKKVTGHKEHAKPDLACISFVSNLRKRSRDESTPLANLYEHELTTQNKDDIPHLPSFNSIKSAMYRHRRKTSPADPAYNSDGNSVQDKSQ